MKVIDIIKNIFLHSQVVYIVESAEWSIKWDGFYIVKNLKKIITARRSSSVVFIKNSIIHFGSVNTYITNQGFRKVHPSNKIVLTWFHVVPNDPRLKFIPDLNHKVALVHTTSEITKNELIKNGLDPALVLVVPLGVDLEIFHPISNQAKERLKARLELPLGKKIIGSFQKDGVGWGAGDEPKLIKGPDIFCDAVIQLAKSFSIHVLLTGPARGYVKNRLHRAGISFTYSYVKNYHQLVDYYNVLDLYLITSRVEGGPKSLLESMACGIPFVSTPVGMVSQAVNNTKDGLVAQKFEAGEIVSLSKNILENEKNTAEMVKHALETVKKYRWDLIVSSYFNQIYKKLI